MKLARIMTLLLCINYNGASFAYDTDDLDKFKNDNECVNCNFNFSSFPFQYPKSEPLFNSNVSESTFTKATITSTLVNANFTKTSLLSTVFLSDCFSCNFTSATAWNLHLDYTAGHGYMDMTGSNFTNADLSNADLHGSNLSDCNFEGAIIDNANLRDTILIGSNLTEEQINSASNICNTVMPDGKYNECKW